MTSQNKHIKHGLWVQNGIDFNVREVVECSIEAEAAGWDGIFVSDAPSWGYSDPWTVLAAIAVKTKKIRIGTWITPIPLDLPWRVAHALASLDQLSNGRVILGAGLGTPTEYKMFTGSYNAKELGRKYDEALEIISGLWKGEEYSFSGEFFNIENAKMPVLPVQQPRIPIILGAWWPNKKPFRRAARWDGIMPYWPSLYKNGKGPQGEEQTGTVEQELKDLLNYYSEVSKEPGEIVLPYIADNKTYLDLCIKLGVTWFMTTTARDIESIKKGPSV